MHAQTDQLSTDRALGQWCNFTDALYEKYRLSEDERIRIYKYIEYAAEDLSAANAVYSCFQSLAEQRGSGLKSYAYQVLNEKGKAVLEEHFAAKTAIPSVLDKVEKVTKFTLNYLITLNAMYRSQQVRLIDESYWQRHNLHEITVNELLDRVPFGSEVNPLGEPELRYVISMIEREIGLLGQQSARLEHQPLVAPDRSFRRIVDDRIITVGEMIRNIDIRRCSRPTQYYYTHLQEIRKLQNDVKQAIEGNGG